MKHRHVLTFIAFSALAFCTSHAAVKQTDVLRMLIDTYNIDIFKSTYDESDLSIEKTKKLISYAQKARKKVVEFNAAAHSAIRLKTAAKGCALGLVGTLCALQIPVGYLASFRQDPYTPYFIYPSMCTGCGIAKVVNCFAEKNICNLSSPDITTYNNMNHAMNGADLYVGGIVTASFFWLGVKLLCNSGNTLYDALYLKHDPAIQQNIDNLDAIIAHMSERLTTMQSAL